MLTNIPTEKITIEWMKKSKKHVCVDNILFIIKNSEYYFKYFRWGIVFFNSIKLNK